ncbi:hypothetical protein [Acinetobacter sp.]|jgi:hypothetical protein|uniref:hypothetical protein n=1 Tax=Acinetobacter sp. TaxID=472 RepID=UPI0033421A8B
MSEALCAFPTWFAASSCLANRYVYKENEVFDLTEHHIELLKLLIWCDMKINDGLVDFSLRGIPYLYHTLMVRDLLDKGLIIKMILLSF